MKTYNIDSPEFNAFHAKVGGNKEGVYEFYKGFSEQGIDVFRLDNLKDNVEELFVKSSKSKVTEIFGDFKEIFTLTSKEELLYLLLLSQVNTKNSKYKLSKVMEEYKAINAELNTLKMTLEETLKNSNQS